MLESIKFWIARLIVEIGVVLILFSLLVGTIFLNAWFEARAERKRRENEAKNRIV